MTRLIDADVLLDTLQKLFDIRYQEQIFAGGRDADVTWNDAIYHIKSAPTVDAIPISWINAWYYRYRFYTVDVSDMLAGWEAQRKEE